MAKKGDNKMNSDIQKVTDAEVVPAEATPVAKPANLIKEFTVPPDQQEPIRKADQEGAAIQRELGALELRYLSQKNMLLQAYEQNRKGYQKLLEDAGKAVGVDFSQLTDKERWDFDFAKMTFKHVDLQ